jgi:hypothetical protein
MEHLCLIDNGIMSFVNAMMDIPNISIVTRSCHNVHVAIIRSVVT